MATATPKLKRRKPNSNGKPKRALIPTVLYLRRSKKKQMSSIAQQRSELMEYAQENGYERIREYVEDGISGDDTENRTAFQRMRADVAKGDFQVILCWDLERFGRPDSLDFGYWTYPFRHADPPIDLITLDEGKVDWKTARGRKDLADRQEAAHGYLLKLSKGVTRGQIRQALRGSWIGSKPYGYEINTIKDKDLPSELRKKSNGWRGKLMDRFDLTDFDIDRDTDGDDDCEEKDFKELILGDYAHIRLVERIFKEFTGVDDRSLCNISARLAKDGVDTPGWGKKGRANRWRFDTVKAILENPAYVGTFVFNRVSRSKYNHVANGKRAEGGRVGINPESDWFVIENHHPAIISQVVFDKAQAKLAKNKLGRGKSGHSPHSPETNPYLFPPGLLKCGRCGENLWGMESRVFIRGSASDPWKERVTRYECSQRKYHQNCPGTFVREDDLFEALSDYLRREFGISDDVDDELRVKAMNGTLTAKDLPTGFNRLRTLMIGDVPKESDPNDVRREIKKVEADIKTVERNMLYAKDEQDYRSAEAERSTLRERLAELQADERNRPTAHDINTSVLHTLKHLFRLPFGKLARKSARHVLTELESITVHTELMGVASDARHRTRHKLKRCEFRFNSIRGITGKSNPHQPD